MALIQRAVRQRKVFLNPVPASVGDLRTMFQVLLRYMTNKEERTPRQALGPFRTDASVYEDAPKAGLRVTWMGHSSMLVEIDGVTVLIDPVWDQRAGRGNWRPKLFFAPALRSEWWR